MCSYMGDVRIIGFRHEIDTPSNRTSVKGLCMEIISQPDFLKDEVIGKIIYKTCWHQFNFEKWRNRFPIKVTNWYEGSESALIGINIKLEDLFQEELLGRKLKIVTIEAVGIKEAVRLKIFDDVNYELNYRKVDRVNGRYMMLGSEYVYVKNKLVLEKRNIKNI